MSKKSTTSHIFVLIIVDN